MRWLGLFLMSLFLMPLEATIQKSQSITQFFDSIEVCEDDLVVFDIDLTLIATTEPALHYEQIKRYRQSFKELCEWNPLLKTLTLELIPRLYPSMLMELELPGLIEQFKNQGATVLALTASSSHPLGWDDLGPKLRYHELMEHGICLSHPLDNYYTFDTCDVVWDYFPTYYEGVITAGCSIRSDNLNSKGQIVSNLVSCLPRPPRRVIFIDDSTRHVESVQEALEGSEIEYLGIVYRGVELIPSKDVSQEQFETVWKHLISQAQSIIETYFSE